MTSAAAEFNEEDLDLLLPLLSTAGTGGQSRRPPWTWSVLHRVERAALARMIDIWIEHYHHVHATKPTDLVPPCWRQHAGLAAELAVQVWLWYAAHVHPQTTPLIAGDYYLRHLPGFRARIDHLLGASPPECRRGQHPTTWRSDTDAQLAAYTAATPEPNDEAIDILGTLHFAFPHPNSHSQT